MYEERILPNYIHILFSFFTSLSLGYVVKCQLSNPKSTSETDTNTTTKEEANNYIHSAFAE